MTTTLEQLTQEGTKIFNEYTELCNTKKQEVLTHILANTDVKSEQFRISSFHNKYIFIDFPNTYGLKIEIYNDQSLLDTEFKYNPEISWLGGRAKVISGISDEVAFLKILTFLTSNLSDACKFGMFMKETMSELTEKYNMANKINWKIEELKSIEKRNAYAELVKYYQETLSDGQVWVFKNDGGMILNKVEIFKVNGKTCDTNVSTRHNKADLIESLAKSKYELLK